jgi:hypothetical protein
MVDRTSSSRPGHGMMVMLIMVLHPLSSTASAGRAGAGRERAWWADFGLIMPDWSSSDGRELAAAD